MDSFSITIEIFIALTSGLVSALGVWFKLKSTVELHKLMIDNMKEDCESLNARVTRLKATVEANRERNETAVADLKKEMGDMEMRIIKAIHELTTEINKK
jgi:hypothetical protein